MFFADVVSADQLAVIGWVIVGVAVVGIGVLVAIAFKLWRK